MSHSDFWLPQGNFKPLRYKAGGVGNWSSHLPFANDLVACSRPGLLVELGTHYGESYFGFCQAIFENNITCTCYAVDTWVGEQHAGSYEASVYQEVDEYNKLNYGSFSYLLRTTFDEARAQFSDGSIDLLHIDGLHTYNAIRHDFEHWFSAVRPGGIILLHDISAKHSDFGVWRFWEELEDVGERFAFPHGWGLGVFRKPGGELTNAFLSTLFTGPRERQTHIQRFYALCGRSLEYEFLKAQSTKAQEGIASLQVYPEKATGYSAESVYETVFRLNAWEHIRLDVLSGSPQGGLRVDISERTGIIDVAGLRVAKASSGVCLLQVAGTQQLMQLAVGGTMTRLEQQDNSEFCRFVSSGNDPQLFLQLNANLTDQPLILDLWVRMSTDVAILLPYLTGPEKVPVAKNEQPAQTSGNSEMHVLKTENQLDQPQQLPTVLEGRSTEAERQEIELTSRPNEAENKLHTLREELESLSAEYRRARGEIYVLKRDLTNANERAEKADLAIARITDECSRSQASNESLTASFGSLTDEVVNHRAQNAELSRMLDAIVTSRSWRITAPLRRLMSNVRG